MAVEKNCLTRGDNTCRVKTEMGVIHRQGDITPATQENQITRKFACEHAAGKDSNLPTLS